MGLEGPRVSGPTKVHLCPCCTEQNGYPASHPLLPLEASYGQDLTDSNWQESRTGSFSGFPPPWKRRHSKGRCGGAAESPAPLGCGTGVSLCPDVTVQTWRSTRSVNLATAKVQERELRTCVGQTSVRPVVLKVWFWTGSIPGNLMGMQVSGPITPCGTWLSLLHITTCQGILRPSRV